jgi:hypothetical protein
MHRSLLIALLCVIAMASTHIVEYSLAVVSLLEKYQVIWVVKNKRELHSSAQMMHHISSLSGHAG